jgi:predicted anti-sigma-YlaC factor YlaD
MKCEDFKDLLSPYIDGATSNLESRLVREHLGKCQSCLKEYNKLLKLEEMVRSIDAPDVPEDLWDRIEEAVYKEKQAIARRLDRVDGLRIWSILKRIN